MEPRPVASMRAIPQRRQLFLRQNPFEFQVKLDPLALKNVREQMLRVQTRTLDCALLKISGRRLQNFEDSHGALPVARTM